MIAPVFTLRVSYKLWDYVNDRNDRNTFTAWVCTYSMAQIRVTDEQRKQLHDEKEPGESYADVLERKWDISK